MDVLHGPRRTSPGIYDAWRAVLRASQPRFEFTDSPFQHSLPMTLAFAATAGHPTAVLTSPLHVISDQAAHGVPQRARDRYDMVRVGLLRRPLTATAAVAWSADLPGYLQQVLFNTADAGFISADLSRPLPLRARLPAQGRCHVPRQCPFLPSPESGQRRFAPLTRTGKTRRRP
jgi:hypothetical protein